MTLGTHRFQRARSAQGALFLQIALRRTRTLEAMRTQER